MKQKQKKIDGHCNIVCLHVSCFFLGFFFVNPIKPKKKKYHNKKLNKIAFQNYHLHELHRELNSYICSSSKQSTFAIRYTKNSIKNKQNKCQYKDNPAKYINAFQIYRNVFSFTPFLCCVYLVGSHGISCNPTQLSHKISCIQFGVL